MSYVKQQILGGGISNAGVLLQTSGTIGGKRHVFVGLVGDHGFVYPTIGGHITNPFNGVAKAYAGDLCEYDPTTSEVKILKTYEVAEAVEAASTTVKIVRDGYRHRPLVGDILMVAPDELTGTGTAVTVTAVSKTTDSTLGDIWTLTLSDALGAADKGAVLVEAAEAGSGKSAMVTNPNAFFPSDTDFFYNPNDDEDGSDEYYKVRYTFTPCLAGQGVKMYKDRMQPLPASILALNKSMWNGWFEL